MRAAPASASAIDSLLERVFVMSEPNSAGNELATDERDDLLEYRPVNPLAVIGLIAGLVSILHRVSDAAMFLLVNSIVQGTGSAGYTRNGDLQPDVALAEVAKATTDDATIAKQLPINQPGMLVHDYPDTLSSTGWYHNLKPMEMAEDTIMHWGKPSNSPRQHDGQSEP